MDLYLIKSHVRHVKRHVPARALYYAQEASWLRERMGARSVCEQQQQGG